MCFGVILALNVTKRQVCYLEKYIKGEREMTKILLAATMLIFGMVGSASALLYTDTYNAGGIKMSSHLFSPDDIVSWDFDITDDLYNGKTQDVTSAQISLSLTDDGGFELWEFADLNVGTNAFAWEVDTGNIDFTLSSLITLSATGTISASLKADAGDFYFNSATLTANATDPANGTAPANDTAPVPEPSTMILMGAGLLGILGYNRKRSNKKN